MNYWKWCILGLIIFALWGLSTVAFAAEPPLVFRYEGLTWRLFPSKHCHVPTQRKDARQLEWIGTDGTKVKGCYVEHEGMYHFGFDDGDWGMAPVQFFKPDSPGS